MKIDSMKVYIFLLVLSATAYYSNAEEKHKNSTIKAMIIREIMRKVSNITLNSLSKVPNEKKALVLNKIELKLRKTASGLTDGFKYVKLIMDEFKNKAFNNTEQAHKKESIKKANSETETIDKEIKENEHNEKVIHEKELNERESIENEPQTKDSNALRTGVEIGSKDASFETEKRMPNRKVFDNQTKEHIIRDISNKIESMAKSYLRESQTFEQKQKIFQKIKKRIVDSSRRKHMMIHNQHNELKAYTNLITQGLELSMKKLLLASQSRRMDDVKEDNAKSDTVDNNTFEMNMAHINEYKTFFAELWNETSIDPRCEAVVEEICIRIGSLRKLTCGDGKIISLNQLCDGVFDCWNEADEINCTTKAIEKSNLALSLMSDIDQSMVSECFQPITPNDMFFYHHKIVRKVLDQQLRLLKKYEGFKFVAASEDKNNNDNENFIKRSVSDATLTVSSLSDVFDTFLCTTRDDLKKNTELKNATRKSINPSEADFADYESIHADADTKWWPKSCTCKEQFCKSANCDTRCKRICWQKYSLNKWQCKSITGDTSISLDLICDGKLDCFDETDEASCTADSSITKYEANNVYKDLLEIISLKSLSMEFERSRNKIAAESGLVRQLQKLTTKSYTDIHAIKLVRDDYFKTLVHIFEDTMQTSKLEELDEIYEYLRALNEKMIAALKLSHTGNEHVVAPAGCFCNNGTCALVRCSRKCNATCLIEPILTKFSCNDNSTSVHIKAVCNGKKECPNEEDEKDCHKEVCRAHHLVVLRHNLQRAGVTLKGTVLGDVLDSWKSKVMSSLIVAQGSERPNHKMLEDIVIKVLRDLVTTYATMDETKKTSSEFVTNEFRNMSSIVKQTLKLCDK